MLGSFRLYLEGMRITVFQVSGFYFRLLGWPETLQPENRSQALQPHKHLLSTKVEARKLEQWHASVNNRGGG